MSNNAETSQNLTETLGTETPSATTDQVLRESLTVNRLHHLAVNQSLSEVIAATEYPTLIGQMLAEVITPKPLPSPPNSIAGTMLLRLSVQGLTVPPAYATPVWTQDQFATAFLRLLPQGAAWPTYGESQMAQSLYPLAAPYADNSLLAAALMVDCFPASTVQLAPEWMATLSLPGPCQIGYANAALTQQAIVAQLTDNGGCSQAYFQSVAVSLGFAVSIRTFMPLRIGLPVGSPVLADAYAFIIEMTVISGGMVSLLACEMRRRLPAHLMLYIVDVDGSVTSPPPILYPAVSVTVSGGVATFYVPTPSMQPASVQYTGASNGTVVFPSGATSVVRSVAGAVSMYNPINLTIAK